MDVLGTYTSEVKSELERTIAIAIVNKVARAKGSLVAISLRDLARYADTRISERLKWAYEYNPRGLTFIASQFNRIMDRLARAGIVERIDDTYIIGRDSPIWDFARREPSEAVGMLLAWLSQAN